MMTSAMTAKITAHVMPVWKSSFGRPTPYNYNTTAALDLAEIRHDGRREIGQAEGEVGDAAPGGDGRLRQY